MNNVLDITSLLPQLLFYFATLLMIIVASVYTLFHLYTWSLLFMRFKEVRPNSRIALWIEERFVR